MEKWEYKTMIYNAHIDNLGVREYLAKKYPGWKPSKFAPETMEYDLDKMGEAGWELVAMHSIPGRGDNMDVYYQGELGKYSNAYFCAFKRRKE